MPPETESADDARASTARVRGVVRLLQPLMALRPAGLLTDVDGTISRITAHTHDATVERDTRRDLGRLSKQLALVAVVTGRSVERAQQMVNVTGLASIPVS